MHMFALVCRDLSYRGFFFFQLENPDSILDDIANLDTVIEAIKTGVHMENIVLKVMTSKTKQAMKLRGKK